MIRLRQVEKRFADVRAVRGVTLDIERGQVVGVLGPNGAGKTTTIRMIAGLLPPSAGTVEVDGLDSVADSLAVRARLGYMPESSPLYPEMRVRSYLAYRAGLYAMRGRAAREAVERVIDRCRLGEARSRRIGTLSKGFRQRVGLAAAILHDPAVVILDEPTSGLDPAQVVEARELIRELSGRRTMLIVSHILPEVERTCDRVVVFVRGRVRADGPPGALAASNAAAGSRVVVEFRGESPHVPAAVGAITGLVRSEAQVVSSGWVRLVLGFSADTAESARESVFAACSGAGLVVRELRGATPSLEEFYVRLIESAEAPEGRPGAGGAAR